MIDIEREYMFDHRWSERPDLHRTGHTEFHILTVLPAKTYKCFTGPHKHNYRPGGGGCPSKMKRYSGPTLSCQSGS
ncbi:hypothetical protein HanXRQr2_Chr15g0690271 [Helianthus annuus]|uniref:Uncharacterized protein n=1 Tax=Helianthus annuus TaxID=4232 RepID=A0A251S7I6_HELAN|nr:hypothetical protein HanXRQr2_Chr15g0690271 [Helianthus annuus]KAJ0455345.1 hypothetical protein HanIR_Chr15g0750161 [Helianthus annuus]KAJ0831013.1 hypothetical protein HanPSC8_Chr15g0662141 [Helianthus annuus]